MKHKYTFSIIPLIIFGMGIIPLFIGLFLYLNPQYLSGKITVRGELFTPPLDARPWFDNSGKWQILLVAPTECGEECQQMLYYGRQVHEALKEERQNRVERAVFVRRPLPEDIMRVLESQSPPITIIDISDQQLSNLFSPSLSDIKQVENNIFLVDPLGNLMLRHKPINSIKQAKNLLKDINHLLRASHIG